MELTLILLSALTWGLSFVFTIYAAYNLIVALLGLKRRKAQKQFAPKGRFAVLVAARNEECVIGNLVESLNAQDYPKELYDVYVIPNNCTDDTAGAARRAGAKIIDCNIPVKSKGEVLTMAFDKLLAEQNYDAFCVFDADNLVDPGFLKAMNNAYCGGAKAAQSYRDSKNPHDSAVSGSYSIYYWMISRFYSQSHSNLGLTAIINGSGWMVSAELLRKMGGFHTFTMTEDIEFTAQCILENEKVAWVPEARIYDEQPLTFEQSWKQRKRWSTGMIQGCGRYCAPLLKRAVKDRSALSFDQFVFFLAPVMQVLCFVSMILSAVTAIFYQQVKLFPDAWFYIQLFSPAASFLGTAFMAYVTVLIEKKYSRKMWKGILYYWVFVMSWIPINLLCLFKKSTVWHEIKHTRSVRIADLPLKKES